MEERFMIIRIDTTGIPEKKENREYYEYKEIEKYKKSRMIRATWIIFDRKKKIRKERDYIIKPKKFKIKKEISEINKIYQKEAKEKGEEIEKVLKKIKKDMKKSSIIIGHNYEFIENIIKSEIYRIKGETRMIKMMEEKKTICTSDRTKEIIKLPNNKKPTLGELYKYYCKKEMKKETESIEKVKIILECFFKMMKKK